ncbi:MAG: sigma-54 interaction domain-containing protein, partial [Acidobacteriota bacterium]
SSLEPEERPALHAHAGDPQEALASAAGTPFEPLWRGALTAETVDDEAWQALRALEPYRAARLVHDLELGRPRLVPVYWRRTAAATLRQVGAAAFADRVEDREQCGWAALERHLRAAGGLGELFAAAGYPEARLTWRSGDEERTLVEGSGGEDELGASWGGGELRLRAPLIDTPLRALFAVVLREPPPAAAVPSGAAAGLIGDSPALRQALRRADRLASGELPVLVHGETGTGKELVARRVHAASRRAGGPFLPVNCAALSETLLLSDLFGHVRGAFTGADRDRTGVFEAARGGTVFLDEVGDLPLHAQGVLLRVLQEREVRRLGESHPRRVDVRVIAATHRDLGRRVAEGTFRQDLYYRLRVGHVRLPPLRERGDDVLRLAAHFLARRDGAAPRLSAAARGELARHSWPGNVRELENVLEAAAALAEAGEIHPEHLDLASAAQPLEAAAGDYHQRIEDFRRRLVEEALAAAGGRRAEAARKLGLTRQALSYLVRQLGIVAVR